MYIMHAFTLLRLLQYGAVRLCCYGGGDSTTIQKTCVTYLGVFSLSRKFYNFLSKFSPLYTLFACCDMHMVIALGEKKWKRRQEKA